MKRAGNVVISQEAFLAVLEAYRNPMGFFEFALGVIVIGCSSGVIVTVVDRIFGNKGQADAAEFRAAQDRIRSLEAQLVDSHRQSDMLQKQLE